MKYFFQLQLLDAIVLSQSSASTQNHLCLDHVPGSALLGCIAAKYYAKGTTSAAEAMALFHNGAVRFGPCYPAVNGQLALPVPASWHGKKGVALTTHGQSGRRLVLEHISNQANPKFVREDKVQYQQCRDGFIAPNGELAQVKQQWFTKTAIDADTGRAAESQLFNYAALSAGQVFIGFVECDEAHWQQLKPLLQGEHRLGRSKGAEFGRVRIQCLDAMQDDAPKCHGTTLTLWCASDLQVVNQHGQPTYTPALCDLLPGSDAAQARLVPQSSFIRTRQQSLFNQKRAGVDSEQLLIQKGSVLVYQLAQPLSPAHLLQLGQGVGVNQQFGLGWLLVNPDWAQQAQVPACIDALGIALPAQTPAPSQHGPATPLLQWVQARAGAASTAAQDVKAADALVKSLLHAYSTARRYSGIRNAQAYGPNRTQWQRVITLLKQQDDEWFSKTFGKGSADQGNHSIAKAHNDEFGWGVSWDNGQIFITFADHCKALLANLPAATVLRALEKMTRYDLSEHAQLLKAESELNITIGGEA